MAPGGPDQPGAPLPAPYRSPWRALASDLVAVAADLGLRGRELLRRNRQGELPSPRFWPESLAAGFWPLVVVGVLALVGAGLGWLARPGLPPVPAQGIPTPVAAIGTLDSGPGSGHGPASEGLSATDGSVAGPGLPLGFGEGDLLIDLSNQLPGPAPLARPGEPQVQRPLAGPVGEPTTAEPSEPGFGGRSGSAANGAPPASGALPIQSLAGDGALAVDPSPPDPNPLASWLQRPEAAGLVLQAQVDPGASRIELVVAEAFRQLNLSEQQQRADLWLGWAQDWGYDQVELRDPGGALLGREARVGGGMILGFSP